MANDKQEPGEEVEGADTKAGIDDELKQINLEHFRAYQLLVQRIVDYLCQPGANGKPAVKRDIKPLDLLRLSNSLNIVQKGQRLAKQMDKRGTQPQARWIRALRKQALADVAFHRALYNRPLFPPQVEAISFIERHIHDKSGKVITVRSARQTMKNECSGMLCVRALEHYRDIGGVYIRTAPTWRPQMVNSKQRVERFLKLDPLINQDYQRREGFIFQHGQAQVLFLSSDKRANVVGHTASIALDIDEAHKVDQGKFEEDFGPMAAYHNVPIIMWGVAADKQDLLYEYVQHNLEHQPELNLSYPASVWCELLPQYAKHYEERVSKLGADHPVILTQYDLVDVDSLGGYFTKAQQTSLLSGDHEQYDAAKGNKRYVVTIDIAGEAEEEETDPLIKAKGARDSSVALVWEVDWEDKKNNYPMCRLVNIYWWTGKSLGDRSSGLPGQQTILLKLLNAWRPTHTVVDARGVGEQIAKYLADRWSGVEAYSASPASISQDCYGLLAMVNNERVKVCKDDQSDEYAELVRQIKHTGYEIRAHDQMRIVKPHGKGHIDMAKAMTYLYRALLGFVPAAISGLEPPKGWYRSPRKRVWG